MHDAQKRTNTNCIKSPKLSTWPKIHEHLSTGLYNTQLIETYIQIAIVPHCSFPSFRLLVTGAISECVFLVYGWGSRRFSRHLANFYLRRVWSIEFLYGHNLNILLYLYKMILKRKSYLYVKVKQIHCIFSKIPT